MVIVPNSDIRLIKVPLTLDSKNQLRFNNKSEQFNYFYNLPHLDLDNATYQRKDGVIRYPELMDNIQEYNYVMYQNKEYTNKWFYAFIVDMRYVNDNMSEIVITTDVWQTWQFDLIFKESFVEREMIESSDDIPGSNLIPESFETGEYVIGGTAEIDDLEPVYIIAYAVETFGHTFNGFYSGIEYLAYENGDLLRAALTQIAMGESSEDTGIDKIIAIFSVPRLAFNGVTIPNDVMNNSFTATPRAVNLQNTPSQLDGYVPKNAKLLTYPFCYLAFNPSGSTGKIFRYEDFQNGHPSFSIISEINPNPTVCVIPQNYRNSNGDDLADICTISGYPNVSWSVDVYNVWLAQNSQMINLNMKSQADMLDIALSSLDNSKKQSVTSAALSFGGNAATGNSLGIVNSLASASFNLENIKLDEERLRTQFDNQIYMQLAEQQYHAKLPNDATFGSNNTTLIGYNKFDKNIFTRYTIKRQFAERIDDYFSMFGYKTNRVKVPNINNRPNWNFIKTTDINIVADIPQGDLALIKAMFDNGFTIWHNPQTFLDYSQNNK